MARRDTEGIGADEGAGAVTGVGAPASRGATKFGVWYFLAGGVVLSLFAPPAVVLLNDSGRAEAVALALIAAAAAALVALRIARLVRQANAAREVLASSEARFRALVQHAADVIIVLSEDGDVRYMSPAVKRVLGREWSEFVGTSFLDHVDAMAREQAAGVRRALRDLPDQALSVEFQVWDGAKWRWVEATWTNRLDDPAVGGIVGNLRDITDRKRSEAFAAAETRVLESILSGAPIGDTLTSLICAVEAAINGSHGTIALLDAESGDLERVAAPSLPAEFIAQVHGPNLDEIHETLSTSSMQILTEFDREVDTRYVERVAVCREFGFSGIWSVPVLRSNDGQFVGIFALYQERSRDPSEHEITLLERARDLIALAIDRAERTRQLGHLALHDTLTGLPNRALAQDRIDDALAHLEHSNGMVAVLFVDLDRFKLVNDGLGHEVGDELLVDVSRRLRAAVRRHDTIARFGGDEFIVVCEDLGNERQAEELAERVIDAFADPFTLARAEITITASVGIAVAREAGEHASSLIRDADAAMYRAKRRGGARHVVFDDAMHTQAVSRLLTERGLREALERDQFRVVYQPQFDLRSSERVAVEALLRWDHPVRGNILPADFVAIAEETGIIVPIGEWVLARACELVRSSPTAGPGGGSLAVSANVSARQLARASFVDAVEHALREYAIDPQLLCLEIAEEVVLDDIDTTSDALHALKDLGVRLSIDDFGTGASSLTYLRRFPFDELKIDPAFIAGIGQSAADDAIVAATIDIARALGMTVVAEGVESESQRVRLCELGCDRAQGFHLGPPVEMASRHLMLVEQEPA